MTALAVWLVGWLMRRPLTIKERNRVVIHILDSLGAVPLSAIIETDENEQLRVAGKLVDAEMGRVLMQHAQMAQRNKALNLIREQVQYEAFVGSAIKAILPDDMLLYRGALWWGQRVAYYLAKLAPEEEPGL